MKILIDIGHPAHVHLFRNLYHRLKEQGNEVFVTTQEIQIVKELLNFYLIDYIVVGQKKKGLFGKGLSVIYRTLLLSSFILRKKIDICIGSTASIVQAAFISFKPSIFMDDDDDPIELFVVKTAHPFASVILSPKGTIRKSKKTIYYNGYHELAYLHPFRFIPNESIIQKYSLTAKDKYFVLRFVALTGHHDKGQEGINMVKKRELINLLTKKGRVFITSEKPIEPEFEQYRIPVSPEEIHHFLYYATMFIGDSQTMSSESAVLGTPSIRSNSFVGKISYLEDEEHNYGLTYGFKPENFNNLLLKVEELLANPNLKELWQEKRLKMLKDKIDVTALMVWFIENYPESANIMKENPDYQHQFK